MKALGKKWSIAFDVCEACGTADRPHMAQGLCRECYLKAYSTHPSTQVAIKDSKRRYHERIPRAVHRAKREARHFDGRRQAVLKRDGYRCTKCRSRRLLLVHHIDHSGRGARTHNNSLDNLATLCRACHARHHSTAPGWSRAFAACVVCGTVAVPHRAFGHCITCYSKRPERRLAAMLKQRRVRALARLAS